MSSICISIDIIYNLTLLTYIVRRLSNNFICVLTLITYVLTLSTCVLTSLTCVLTSSTYVLTLSTLALT